MKRLVADTGPVLHLHQAGALELLALIGEVSLTPMVLRELRTHAVSLWPGPLPSWVSLVQPSINAQQRAIAWTQAGLLHMGEAEALARTALALATSAEVPLLLAEAHSDLAQVLLAAGRAAALLNHFGSRYSTSPSRPPSRPYPLSR